MGPQTEELIELPEKNDPMWNKFKKLVPWITSPLALNTLFGVGWGIVFLICYYSGFSSFLTHRLVKPIEFSIRAFVGRDVPFADRLKVFGLDDSTAAKLGRPYLDQNEWTALLQKLKKNNPSAILIDSLFTSDLFDTKSFDLSFETNATRVVSGSYLSPREIKYRSIVPVDKIFQHGFSEMTLPDWVYQRQGSYIYGPSSLNLGFIDFVGHLQILRPTSVPLLLKDRSGTVIPHVALHASQNILPEENGIRLESGMVPVDADGHTQINYLSVETAAKQVRTLKKILEASVSGKSYDSVKPGDVVLILFNYTTANTDVVDSPFGRIPGGYVLMSMVNSVLNGRWIKELSWEWPLCFVGIILGLCLGHFSPVFRFWGRVVAASIIIEIAGISSFVFADTVVPWVLPLVLFCGSALSSFSSQLYRESLRKLYLEMEMATAAALQKNYFPAPDFHSDRYDIATFYHSADAVGGDWYTYYTYNEYLYVHIGDVTGHGTSAALLASYAKGATDMIRHEFSKNKEPFIPLEVIHTNLNSILCTSDDCSALMTMISVMINLETGECFCLNSGHRPALVADLSDATPATTAKDQKGSGNVASVTSKTPFILGFREFPAAIRASSRILNGGEVLFLYSDGLIDVPTSRGIRCNEKSLKKLLGNHAKLAAEELRRLLISELDIAKNKPSDPFIDDVTFIVVKLKLTPTIVEHYLAQ